MPKKFKVSTDNSSKSSKVVGIAIIVTGILVMAAAVYLGYIFLINPKQIAPAENNAVSQIPKVEEQKKTEPIVEDVDSEKKEPIPVVENNDEWVSSATSTQEKSTTTSPFATSTPEISTTTDVIVSGADADMDGLTDAEEAILNTDALKVDSDGDAYNDLSELMNFYNPAGSGKLEDNLGLRTYKSSRFGYLALVPASWNLKETGEGESVIFSAVDNSFFQIISELNPENKDILSWYNSQFFDEPTTADKVIIKNGWQGVYSSDKNIFYLTDEKYAHIYSLSYIPVDASKAVYGNIFHVFVNSFNLVK